MFIFCLDTKNEPKKIKTSADSFVAYLLDICLTHRDKSSVRAKFEAMQCSSLKQMRLPLFHCFTALLPCSSLKQVRLPFFILLWAYGLSL